MARLLIAALVLLAASSRPAAAQDRVTVFLHGFNSNGASWYATASRLGARLRIAPTAPNLPWHLPFDQQASGLHQAASAAGAPPDTVVVGHSNGGLIARQLSTKRPLGGIVTLGSPHAGAPLARNIQAAGVHYLVTGQKLGLLLYMLGASNGTNQFSGIWFSPGLAPLRAAIATLGLALESSTAIAREALFVSTSVPVLSDMVPGSPALSALNSASNLARERAAVPRRVGLVYAARDWWIGAPFVAAQPEYQVLGQRGRRKRHRFSGLHPRLLRLPQLRAMGSGGDLHPQPGGERDRRLAHLQLRLVLGDLR